MPHHEFDARDEFDERRRAFLSKGLGAGVGALAAGGGIAGAARAAGGEDDAFAYEIQLTDEEWREQLTEEAYVVLRKGITEIPKTSALWNETADGVFCCGGCDLPLYDSVWKVELDIGYAFFRQSRENAILMGIDGEPPYGGSAMADDSPFRALIEAHCRRCGSHLGHLLTIRGETLHCINGTALAFQPSSA